MVNVELVYIPADQKIFHVSIAVIAGTTVGEVFQQSGVLLRYPEVEGMSLGIFAKPASLDTVVKSGDRIEIYRPLMVDPKEKRRQRARQKN